VSCGCGGSGGSASGAGADGGGFLVSSTLNATAQDGAGAAQAPSMPSSSPDLHAAFGRWFDVGAVVLFVLVVVAIVRGSRNRE
jgi:hypothetical protein